MRGMRIRPRIRAACVAVAAVLLACAPLHAQRRAIHVSVRAGFAAPDGNALFNCASTNPAVGVDVQGSRRLFPLFSLNYFPGFGSRHDGSCISFGRTVVAREQGGLRLAEAIRVGVGIGGRAGGDKAKVEGAISGGLTAARHSFVDPGDDRRDVAPHLGGGASLVLYRRVVLSLGSHWTRVSVDKFPVGGGTPITESAWLPIMTAQVGLRMSVAR